MLDQPQKASENVNQKQLKNGVNTTSLKYVQKIISLSLAKNFISRLQK